MRSSRREGRLYQAALRLSPGAGMSYGELPSGLRRPVLPYVHMLSAVRPEVVPPKGAICERGSASREGRWTTRLAACRAAHLGPPQDARAGGEKTPPAVCNRGPSEGVS